MSKEDTKLTIQVVIGIIIICGLIELVYQTL
jgi:hypothetical protein